MRGPIRGLPARNPRTGFAWRPISGPNGNTYLKPVYPANYVWTPESGDPLPLDNTKPQNGHTLLQMDEISRIESSRLAPKDAVHITRIEAQIIAVNKKFQTYIQNSSITKTSTDPSHYSDAELWQLEQDRRNDVTKLLPQHKTVLDSAKSRLAGLRIQDTEKKLKSEGGYYINDKGKAETDVWIRNYNSKEEAEMAAIYFFGMAKGNSPEKLSNEGNETIYSAELENLTSVGIRWFNTKSPANEKVGQTAATLTITDKVSGSNMKYKFNY